MKDNTNVGNIWICIYMGEMKPLQCLLWMNLSKYLCEMMVRSKWETTWLQMKKQLKYPHKMTAVSRDLAKMKDILRGSGVCIESNGRITFHSNTAKNKPMWHFWTIIWICVKHWDPKMWGSGSCNAKGVRLAHG